MLRRGQCGPEGPRRPRLARARHPPELCHRPAPCVSRIFSAVRPGTDQAFALALTELGTAAMQAFLGHFAATLLEGVHAALRLDGAGWHIAGRLTVPDNVSLIFLPPYAPELNPIERVWLLCASASSRFVSSPISKPPSMAAAKPGTTSPPNPAASLP
ncbi:transposase [Roseomonas sp. KE2513]|uniref:transposase n=1 Tax=Roseomonas sp. KE2513 TaxID=2479202 RepID=UPI002814C1AC|nr:transposase [Roseomonas sp. KE2513]